MIAKSLQGNSTSNSAERNNTQKTQESRQDRFDVDFSNSVDEESIEKASYPNQGMTDWKEAFQELKDKYDELHANQEDLAMKFEAFQQLKVPYDILLAKYDEFNANKEEPRKKYKELELANKYGGKDQLNNDMKIEKEHKLDTLHNSVRSTASRLTRLSSVSRLSTFQFVEQSKCVLK